MTASELILVAIPVVWIRHGRRVYQARRAGTQTVFQSAWWRFGYPVAVLVWCAIVALLEFPRSHHNPLMVVGTVLMACGAVASLISQSRRRWVS